MKWTDAIIEAKEELGISGYTSHWDEVVELAESIRHDDRVKYREEFREEAIINHQEYLKTDWWKKMRQKALFRDSYKCVDCTEPAREVHHLSYDNKNNPEEINDIISLCTICHKKRHFIIHNKHTRR